MKNLNNTKEVDMNLVVKTHRLNTALQNLSLSEIRLIQIAIVDSREKQLGLNAEQYLHISASRYAKQFNVEMHTAYEVLQQAEKTLFERRFTFLNERHNEVKSRWISQVEYKKGEGEIAIILTPAVVKEITRIDGIEQFFSQYAIEATASFNSVYSVRLYELLVQWKTAKKTPVFELETFRSQMGLGVNEYTRMSDFKRRVLDLAVKEINEKSDIKVSYSQVKKGRTITGFKFKVLAKPKLATKTYDIKEDNIDMFTIDNLTDKQLSRITRSPKFCQDYADRVSPSSDVNKDMNVWSVHFVQELKKDATQFNKRPIREYLDY